MRTHTAQVRVDDEGHLVLPPELAERLGLAGGALVRVEERGNAVAFSRSSASLARVYIEPTTLCNLLCRTCIRNVWDEPPGTMSARTFARVMDGVRAMSPRPTVALRPRNSQSHRAHSRTSKPAGVSRCNPRNTRQSQ
jgi:bifunctional DNA-binding transcriptional regulator/antitoxin component of YhaV-PrlF toxin-antitoxin module